MVVFTFSRIRDYVSENKRSLIGLYHWYKMANKADWKCFRDVKRSFPAVDYVGNDRYVFNIQGNKFRLVAMIHFDIRTVYVRFVGSHADYDCIDDITEI